MPRIVRFRDLEPDWSGPGARVPGTMHWSARWVRAAGTMAGATAAEGMAGVASRDTPKGTVRNDRIGIGQTVLEPGHTLPGTALAVTRLRLVASGAAIVGVGGENETLGELDGLHVPAGEAVALRNNGPGALRLLWIDDAPRS